MAPSLVTPPDVVKSDFHISESNESKPHGNNVREGTTFETSGLEPYYKPIDKYEGRHRYDPDFGWEPEEEKRVVRKVSLVQNDIISRDPRTRAHNF